MPEEAAAAFLRSIALNPDESQYEAVRNSCVAKKPRCETKFSKGKRVRKCYRDCERVAAATVNKQRKADGRAPAKKRKRSKKR